MAHPKSQIHPSRYNRLPGTSHRSVLDLAAYEYQKIQKRNPKRHAYVRSRYFRKDKVFIGLFWRHLMQKHPGDQLRRAKLFNCAIDLIRNTTLSPDTIYGYQNMNISLHRFYGRTRDGFYFSVQIKENKRTNRKDFMSVFPGKKPK